MHQVHHWRPETFCWATQDVTRDTPPLTQVEEALQSTEGVSPGIPVPKPPSIRQTQEYVNPHFLSNNDFKDKENTSTGQQVNQSNTQQGATSTTRKQPDCPSSNPIRSDDLCLQHRSPQAPWTEISNLAAYLARRDLLRGGFKVFDNKLETYVSWKSVFLNATYSTSKKAKSSIYTPSGLVGSHFSTQRGLEQSMWKTLRLVFNAFGNSSIRITALQR